MWKAGSTCKRVTLSDTEIPPAGTWASIHASRFETRIGPMYGTNKRKAPSASAIYHCFAVDGISSDKKMTNIGRMVELPTYEEAIAGFDDKYKKWGEEVKDKDTPLRKDWALPDFFLCNCQTPDYAPSNPVWGKKQEDGPGSALVFYYVLAPEVKQALLTLSKLFPGHSSSARLYNPSTSAPKAGLIGGMLSSVSNAVWGPGEEPNSSTSAPAATTSTSTTSASTTSASTTSSSGGGGGGDVDAASDDLKTLKIEDSDLPEVDKDGNMSGGAGGSKSSSTTSSNSAGFDGDELTAIKQKIRDLKLNINLNAILLLNHFVSSKDEDDIKGRYKAIGKIINLDQVEINGAAKKLVSHYNGTPFLIRTCASYCRGANYFEVDSDVHRFSYLARVALYGIKEKLSAVVFDFGFVIQGNEDDELPEQMLGCCRMSKLSLSQAVHISKLVKVPGKK